MGVADLDLSQAEQRLHDWLAAGRHGEMGWMAAHGHKRSRPAELEPETVRVLSLRMDYLPPDTQPVKVLQKKRKPMCPAMPCAATITSWCANGWRGWRR